MENSRRSWRRVTAATGLIAAAMAWTAADAAAQDAGMAGIDANGEILVADAAPENPPPLPLDANQYVSVRTLDEERVVEFVIGPVELEPGMAHLRLPVQLAEFPVDGWLHGFSIEMRDGAGNEIPMELLHHVNFIDPDKRELFSPISRRVMAAGRETATFGLPRLLGYPIAQGDRMLIAAMFANTLDEAYPDASLHVRFSYSTEADGFLQPRNIFPFYLDVMGPLGTKDFAVPPGKTTMSWEGSPAVDGRILAIGGHVHDYATKLRLVDATTGKTLWEVAPEGEPGGHITGVPDGRFLWTLGKKIRADHVYRIEVDYENPLDTAAPDGGMGAIGGVVWVGKDTEWPAFDREDGTYVADLTNTLTAPDRMHGHGHGGMSVTGDMQMPSDDASPAEHSAHEH